MPPVPAGPLLVAAFEGWNDAGESATGLVEHLEAVWSAERVLEIDPEDYYDFQVNRPTVSLVDGLTREITWPTTRLSVCHLPGGRAVVLLRGIEPNMRWRGFCAELLTAASGFGVTQVVTLGALLADSPHTRPVPVSGTSTDAELADQLGLERSRYEGPTGIVGVFQEACERAGLSAVSFWAAVPHYVAHPPCPKATLALLRRLEDVVGVNVPLGTLVEDAAAWEQQVDELAAEDTDIADYVATLEQREGPVEASLADGTGEELARAFERYLKRQDDEPG